MPLSQYRRGAYKNESFGSRNGFFYILVTPILNESVIIRVKTPPNTKTRLSVKVSYLIKSLISFDFRRYRVKIRQFISTRQALLPFAANKFNNSKLNRLSHLAFG